MRSPHVLNCWLYPELKGFASDEARSRALKEALGRTKFNWKMILILVVGTCVLIAWTLAQGELAFFLLNRGVSKPIGSVLAGVVGIGLGVFQIAMVLRYSRRTVRPLLREILDKQLQPVCAACGYDLRGNTSGTCPECGQEHQTNPKDMEAQNGPQNQRGP